MDTSLIRLINGLLDASSTIKFDVDLPKIVVVGSQSAGKSSVLENCVGREFLPRDTDICTRRPLVLQLINHKTEEYGEFLHNKDEKFTSFDAIRQEIIDDTNRIAGDSKCVSSSPIRLRVYSPSVANLTLVDLPGLTQMSVGDQPKDTPAKIRAMVKDYINSPNCIILAVLPACADLATNEALGLAEEADPGYERTLGVVTKLDLMDEGTDARKVLLNEVHPLKLGYVGVVNRSQLEIQGHVDIETVVAKEKRFFDRNYRDLADRQGTPYLQQVLSEQLAALIRKTLPDLKYKIQRQLARLEEDAKHLFKYNESPRNVMIELLSDFQKNVKKDIEGYGHTVDLKNLSGGTRIHDIFHEWFPDKVDELAVNKAEMKTEIAIAIRNIRGTYPGMNIPDQAFREIVRHEIQRLESPALEAVAEVENIINKTITARLEEMAKYPFLREEVDRQMDTKRVACSQAAVEALKSFIAYNKDYINTENEDFREAISFRDCSVKMDGAIATGQILWKGYLGLRNPVENLEPAMFWFELTRRTLQWFRDETRQVQEYILSLDDLSIGNLARTSWWGKQASLEIAHALGGDIYKNWKKLCLMSNKWDELNEMKSKMTSGGHTGSGARNDSLPQTAWLPGVHTDKTEEVEIVYDLVRPYMEVVQKSIKDMLPKIITSTFIITIINFAETELFSLAARADEDKLMAESEQRKKYREETMKTIETLREALRLISDTYTQMAP